MSQNPPHVIRAAFLERVSLDGIQTTHAAKVTMNSLGLTKNDLLKWMRSAQIQEIRLEKDHVRFTVYPVHHGQPLKVVCSAHGQAQSNNIQFWVLSVCSLR